MSSRFADCERGRYGPVAEETVKLLEKKGFGDLRRIICDFAKCERKPDAGMPVRAIEGRDSSIRVLARFFGFESD